MVGFLIAQRKRNAIHALVRTDAAGERPTAAVPGFAGFQALISAPVEQSKAYYFMTYPEPHQKTCSQRCHAKDKGSNPEKIYALCSICW